VAPAIGTKFADRCNAALHDLGTKRHSVQANSLLDTDRSANVQDLADHSQYHTDLPRPARERGRSENCGPWTCHQSSKRLSRVDLDDDCGKDLKGGAQSHERRESPSVFQARATGGGHLACSYSLGENTMALERREFLINKQVMLSKGTVFYQHCYALIRLNGPGATVGYYEDGDGGKLLFSESF
jgi:hypothetical protein